MMPENYSNEQYNRLEKRTRNLAQEKSHLQLIVKMMNRLGELPGLENTVNTFIQLLLESIGGSNASIYYWIDDTIFLSDINRQNFEIEIIVDDDVKTVFETKKFLEIQSDFEHTKLITNKFTPAYTWICPLLTGAQLIGVIKIDDLHITSQEFKNELQTFFNYAALVIKNEILGQTKLKKAFDQISESEKRFHSLFDNMSEGVALHELEFLDGKPYDYRIINTNPRFDEILGITREQVVGKLSTDAYNSDTPPYFNEYVDVTINKKAIFFETYFALMDKHFEISVVPWQENGFATIFNDITIRKLAEEKLKQRALELNELNATKDKFFSIIAHDLKSPFNSIMGFSELLMESANKKDCSNLDEYAGIILRSSKHALDLLANLMEWAQSKTGRMIFNPEYFNLAKLIDEITSMLEGTAFQKKIKIKKELSPETIGYADKAMVSTILRNLISNAIKFSNPGEAISVSFKENQNEIIVKVSDTGVGIPENVIDKLFRIDENVSTYGTQNEKGTGLGLILCKEFVENHKGKIWVESEEGKGSAFYFTIPNSKVL